MCNKSARFFFEFCSNEEHKINVLNPKLNQVWINIYVFAKPHKPPNKHTIDTIIHDKKSYCLPPKLTSDWLCVYSRANDLYNGWQGDSKI